MTKVEALELALTLAITAPTDEKADECVKMADELAAGMEQTDVELAMHNALQKAINSIGEETNEQ